MNEKQRKEKTKETINFVIKLFLFYCVWITLLIPAIIISSNFFESLEPIQIISYVIVMLIGTTVIAWRFILGWNNDNKKKH